VWKGSTTKFSIQRIFLSDPKVNSETKTLQVFGQILMDSIPPIELVGETIQHFLNGGLVDFDLSLLDFNQCYKVQEKVLLAEARIPWGFVSTYKRIAIHLNMPTSARVVGNALARNPFPIIIPCHRVIKTNGELGGFQGGIQMKRALLTLEGVEFSNKGNVIGSRVYY
jgi:methylated-DNA-[protein]-cysteine S-methyltransferase